MRVHSIQLGYGDDESMPDRIARAAALVRQQAGADLIVLPELWAPGGFSYRSWLERAQTTAGEIVAAIAESARAVGAYVHAGSIIEYPEDAESPNGYPSDGQPVPDGERRLWNTSILLDPSGKVVARYRKIHRFGFGAGEPKLLDAGTDIVTVPIAVDGREVMLGLATCYDLRFPELFRALLDKGAEVVIIPAAWPAARVDHWSLLARARAIEDFVAVVAVNTAGTHSGVEMGGHSVTVAADGTILAEAGPDEAILEASIDIAAIHARRENFPALSDRRL
ncbi:nitrilase-related carbon-nitrogen hydrolase [Saxibacter everestensis]|uniref:Nitrilase-related carbon-nitrogen hydrolase n=1 Tax=Saxibacter everestensis TaxID=2909229 RepID=A0ABY8QU69_9MICO|nr:nitrilase-related carbon-nitrogen hydrolase [Brevibacteriaceae bacterium ZFBP1038]